MPLPFPPVVTAYPRSATIHALLAEQAARTPGAEAVRCAGRALSYAQLDRRANQLAHRLRRHGVGPDVLVALCMERSIELVVALLGILKAGGAYAPLDPGYPADRLRFMLEDTAAPVLLTQEALAPFLLLGEEGAPVPVVLTLDGERWPCADEPETAPEEHASAESMAYVMYTSGSTGRPKGVCATHRGVVRLVRDTDFMTLDASVTMLGFAPISFDASTLEVWGPLLNGGRLVVHPPHLPTFEELGRFIVDEGIDTLWLTSALFTQLVDSAPWSLASVRQLLAGGDVLSPPHVQRALDAMGDGAVLINGYGPTENTTFTCCHRMAAGSVAPSPVPIGRPIANTTCHVVDATMRPLGIGEVGELLAGGDGVARGYLNRPDLTAERFVANPFGEGTLYRTGDLARWNADGTIDFLGRIDSQVKIRGFRIELGEVESALLAHPAVREAVVIARSDEGFEKRLVGYLVPVSGTEAPLAAIQQQLARTLPEYMVPARLVALDAMPLTPTGKVDRRALPAPDQRRPELATPYVAPCSEIERIMAELWATTLRLDRVGVLDHFFELGGSSLLAVRAVERMRERGIELSVVRIFEHPTIAALAEGVAAANAGRDTGQAARDATTERARRERPIDPTDAIAIVGMAGRFPGARSVDELWAMLCAGTEGTTFFGRDGLDPLIPAELRERPEYVSARGIIEGADEFAADHFGVTPRLAQVMDPQHRVFLEVAHEALEHASLDPARFDGTVGVWAGMGYNSYFATHVATRPDLIQRVGALPTQLANEKDYVAINVAYKLNLTGPAVSVHTACSTSLVAVVQAVLALRTGQCDAAIAGGVAITVPQRSGHLYDEGGMLSPDGHTRPFDADARGTVFADGAGAVVLKRLSDAVADGDTVYAVIRGAATNNDGGHKASFTAPSVAGQAAVITRALELAGVSADSISYIEAHGTATPLGDPIEVEALTRAFRRQSDRAQFCALGSVKGNVGHLTAAAGVTGLIKTALALHHRTLPPSINFSRPNPKMQLERTPFRVQRELAPWTSDGPRRAGVSSFGVGGTNAHVVLEEHVAPVPAPEVPARRRELLVLSARTSTALDAATVRLREHLARPDAPALADVAHTLRVGRTAHAHRRAVVASDAADAVRMLEELPPTRAVTRAADPSAPAVTFMFPGQGAQYPGMGEALHRDEPVYRDVVDHCAAVLEPVLGLDLRTLLHPAPGEEAAAAERLRETRLTQPALFVVEYALARLLMSWGIRPTAMIGHSVGELVAACLADVFALDDALRLVAERGRLMQAQPAGAMLSVRAPAAAVAPRLSPELALAAVNAPELCVVAGPHEAVAALQRALEADGVMCRALHTSHAFHSAMMEPAVAPFAALVAGVARSAPTIPFVSSTTGTWITAEQAHDPAYWARHLRETVRFAEGVETLRADATRLWVEVGPRQTACTFVRRPGADPVNARVVPALGDEPGDAEWGALLRAVGHLWCSGVAVQWEAMAGAASHRRVPLPTYPFERRRYWADPAPGASTVVLSDAIAVGSVIPPTAAANGGVPHASGARTPVQAVASPAPQHVPSTGLAATSPPSDAVVQLVTQQLDVIARQLAVLQQS